MYSGRYLTVWIVFSLLFSCKRPDPVQVPDKAFPVNLEFEKFLFQNKIDRQLDGVLRQSEIKNVQSLNLNGVRGLKSLHGIEYFENLKSLTVFDLGIDSLDLSQNTKLEYLSCQTAGAEGCCPSLKALIVKNCKELRYLRCNSNLLTSLDLGQNTKLKELYCGGNLGLLELDLSHCLDLEILDYSFVPKLLNLDLSNHKKLHSVSIASTSVSNLDLRGARELQILNCINTGVSSIDIPAPQNLGELYIMNSKISKIDFTSYAKLHSLSFGNNLVNPDLTSLKSLRVLRCYKVQGDQISLLLNEDLEQLYIQEAGFRNIDLSKNTKLKILQISKMDNLASLDLRSNQGLEAFSSSLNAKLATICVAASPDPATVRWNKDNWTQYSLCK